MKILRGFFRIAAGGQCGAGIVTRSANARIHPQRLSVCRYRFRQALLRLTQDADARVKLRSVVQLDRAVNNITQALIVFDGQANMVLCNERYRQMYGLCPEMVRPGTSLRSLLLHRKDLGNFPIGSCGY